MSGAFAAASSSAARETAPGSGALAAATSVGASPASSTTCPISSIGSERNTGPVGGALFGTTWGVIYSTIGLTAGTVLCFAMGRKWGEPLVRPWLSEHHWNRMNFVLEAEGAILCFILYLIPGFPKDIISYLFGISPIPFWVFAITSTVARVPGTWMGSYFGAHVGEQQYLYAIAFFAVVVAVCLPVFYYRHRIIARFHKPAPRAHRAAHHRRKRT